MTSEPEKPTSLESDRLGRVLRVPAPAHLLEASISTFQQKMAAELEGELRSIKDQVRHSANITAPLRTLIAHDARAKASLDALYQHSRQEEERRLLAAADLRTPRLTTFEFTAQPGFQMIVPPYDLDWSNKPSAYPLYGANKTLGHIKVFALDGVLSAAVGVFLSSPVRSLVNISPFAPFTYQWSGFDYNVPAWIRGSVGVVVYGEGTLPAYDFRAEVWNARLDYPGQRDSGSGSSTVGRELPRDVLITMEPDVLYQLWVWCCIVAHSQASETEGTGGLALGQIDCHVPFMVIDAGPAPIVR